MFVFKFNMPVCFRAQTIIPMSAESTSIQKIAYARRKKIISILKIIVVVILRIYEIWLTFLEKHIQKCVRTENNLFLFIMFMYFIS
jgi:hypothetical protein